VVEDREGDQGRLRGDHDGCAPSVPVRRGGQAALPGDQRERLGHQEQVRQRLRLPSLADRRAEPRQRRHAQRQGRGGLRVRRRGQGLVPEPQGPGLPGHGHRDRPDLRAAGGDGGLRGRDHGRRGREGRHLHHDDRQQGHHHARSHEADEGQGDRRQHRALRQRDPVREAQQATRASSGSTSSRSSTSSSSRTRASRS
jgi:hypothetical protein